MKKIIFPIILTIVIAIGMGGSQTAEAQTERRFGFGFVGVGGLIVNGYTADQFFDGMFLTPPYPSTVQLLLTQGWGEFPSATTRAYLTALMSRSAQYPNIKLGIHVNFNTTDESQWTSFTNFLDFLRADPNWETIGFVGFACEFLCGYQSDTTQANAAFDRGKDLVNTRGWEFISYYPQGFRGTPTNYLWLMHTNYPNGDNEGIVDRIGSGEIVGITHGTDGGTIFPSPWCTPNATPWWNLVYFPEGYAPPERDANSAPCDNTVPLRSGFQPSIRYILSRDATNPLTNRQWNYFIAGRAATSHSDQAPGVAFTGVSGKVTSALWDNATFRNEINNWLQENPGVFLQGAASLATYPSDGDSWTESRAGWTTAAGNLTLSNDRVVGNFSLNFNIPVNNAWKYIYRFVNVNRLNNSAKLVFWHKGDNLTWQLQDYLRYDLFFQGETIMSGSTGTNANWRRIEIDLSSLPNVDPDGDSDLDADDFYDIRGIIFQWGTQATARNSYIDGLNFYQASGVSGDNTPPVITNVNPFSITSNAARINWNTDEPATSQIEFGINPNYGLLSGLYSSLVTNHSLTLSGLAPDTLYYYRVLSIDGSGNQAIGQGLTFRTLGNLPPIAEAGNNKAIYPSSELKFDENLSRDPDGQIVSYSWDFGDGGTATGITTSHIYNSLGTYTVTLTATDNQGASASDTAQVYVVARPAGNLAGLPLDTTYSESQDTYYGATWSTYPTYYWDQSFETLAKDYFLANNLRDVIFLGLRGDSWDWSLANRLDAMTKYGIKVRFMFPLTGYNQFGFMDYFGRNAAIKYPEALSVNAQGTTNYGQGTIPDPVYPQYKDAWKEFVLYRHWNQFKNNPAWIGWQRSADWPDAPGSAYNSGFSLSDYSLRQFVNSEFFDVEVVDASNYIFIGRRGSESTGIHPDGTPCILYQIYAVGSASYNLSEVATYWQDIQSYHPFHGRYIYLMEQQRIKEALEEFERETGRKFIYYHEGGWWGGIGTLNSQNVYQKLEKPKDWFASSRVGCSNSFDPFPDTDMWGLNLGQTPQQTGYGWEPKLWGWSSLGNPGYGMPGPNRDNCGRISPRQIGYVMSYWVPRPGLQTTIWDISRETLTSTTNLEYYKPFATIQSRMRYIGDWLGRWETITYPNTDVHWSLIGKRGSTLQTTFPILIWFSNAHFDNTNGYYSADATVNFNYNLTPYGLTGSWYAFDAATMSLVGSGSDASNVSLSFTIPAWEWRPIYIFSGTYNPTQTKLLYSSSKPLSETSEGSNLRLSLDGQEGMYYKLAIQTTQAPQGVRMDATTLLPQLSSREEVLNTVAVEGWYYDQANQVLLVSYQEK